MAPKVTLVFSALAVAALAFSALAAGLYLAYCCGRSIERKAKAEKAKAKAKAKAKSKAKAKPKSCKHLNFTRAGSNQYQERKRCNDCDMVFEITCKPLVGSD
jgi:hypothetical protein